MLLVIDHQEMSNDKIVIDRQKLSILKIWSVFIASKQVFENHIFFSSIWVQYGFFFCSKVINDTHIKFEMSRVSVNLFGWNISVS